MRNMSKLTKAKFEFWMNNVFGNKTGSKLRRNDPIQFGVVYNQWVRNNGTLIRF